MTGFKSHVKDAGFKHRRLALNNSIWTRKPSLATLAVLTHCLSVYSTYRRRLPKDKEPQTRHFNSTQPPCVVQQLWTVWLPRQISCEAQSLSFIRKFPDFICMWSLPRHLNKAQLHRAWQINDLRTRSDRIMGNREAIAMEFMPPFRKAWKMLISMGFQCKFRDKREARMLRCLTLGY